jgi:hypothetical protein
MMASRRQMLKKILAGTALAWSCAWISTAIAAAGYPVPSEPNQLFYIQRSMNSNTVVYTARLRKDGALNAKDPIKVFWRRFNTTGEKMELNYLERTQAFGVKVRALAGEPGAFSVWLVSYAKRSAILRVVDGVPRLEAKVAGQPARLVSAFVEHDGHKPVPHVQRVRVYGRSLQDGSPLVEILKP